MGHFTLFCHMIITWPSDYVEQWTLFCLNILSLFSISMICWYTNNIWPLCLVLDFRFWVNCTCIGMFRNEFELGCKSFRWTIFGTEIKMLSEPGIHVTSWFQIRHQKKHDYHFQPTHVRETNSNQPTQFKTLRKSLFVCSSWSLGSLDLKMSNILIFRVMALLSK